MRAERATDAELLQAALRHRDAVEKLAGTEVRSVIAYTNTDLPMIPGVGWVDEQVILIPEGWAYVNRSWRETSGHGDRIIYDPWDKRDPADASRIIEVGIKVQAYRRLFGRSWVGAELNVTIVPLDSIPTKLRGCYS
jgi:hypothetical protein